MRLETDADLLAARNSLGMMFAAQAKALQKVAFMRLAVADSQERLAKHEREYANQCLAEYEAMKQQAIEWGAEFPPEDSTQ